MEQLQKVPFKTGFYISFAVAYLIFFNAILFNSAASLFGTSLYSIQGIHLLIGTGRNGPLSPQLLIWLVFFIGLAVLVISFLKTPKKFSLIFKLGAAAVGLLLIELAIINGFSGTFAYYLFTVVTLFGSLLALAHSKTPAEKT